MKKISLLIILVICCLVATSCQKGKEYKYKYSEFKYDDKISWSSSYTDIINEYGKPQNIRHKTEELELVYNNADAAGIGPFYRVFAFSKKTGELRSIFLGSGLSADDMLWDSKAEINHAYATLKESLIAKYGEPSEESEDAHTIRWDDIIEDTRIFMSRDWYFVLLYSSLKKEANMVVHSDLPDIAESTTDTPTSSPTPTFTPNTQGI